MTYFCLLCTRRSSKYLPLSKCCYVNSDVVTLERTTLFRVYGLRKKRSDMTWAHAISTVRWGKVDCGNDACWSGSDARKWGRRRRQRDASSRTEGAYLKKFCHSESVRKLPLFRGGPFDRTYELWDVLCYNKHNTSQNIALRYSVLATH